MLYNRGKIVYFITKEGKKQVAVARNIDQTTEFQKRKKVLIRYIDDDSYKPIMKDGQQVSRLISPDRLTIIGFVD